MPDWFRGDPEVERERQRARETQRTNGLDHTGGVTLDDFWCCMSQHKYIYVPTGEMWPASSVNDRLGTVGNMKASRWLAQHKPVEQMTWQPGQPQIIPNMLFAEGAVVPREEVNSFNLYRPSNLPLGDPDGAHRWIDHVKKVYPEDVVHIIRWLAHRVQRPEDKINHALVLGGKQGIGKDTLLEPVKQAVGPWNFQETKPDHMLGRFNSFLKSIILRVSEARDLGTADRYTLYEHMKTYTAAPPDVLRCDEKFMPAHAILNVCGVLITTNHKTTGIYLPADDRRHYVAWSDRGEQDFPESYWKEMWDWYQAGGVENVAAYLTQLDLSDFNSKAPPAKTAAFWEIVHASSAPEDAEVADVLDRLGNPAVVTLSQLIKCTQNDPANLGEFGQWLSDRRNRRTIPHRLEACGYCAVQNGSRDDGLWTIYGKRQVIYGKTDLAERDRQTAAAAMVGR